jgi:3-hydroxyacyl-[acyl-carrier-protein] dehydratase
MEGTEEALQVHANAKPGAVIEIAQIMELIPHRYPFLLVDRIVDVVPGERATGIKNVTINEQFFQGHFPDRPVMPGVLVIEAMAQTAAVLVIYTVGGGERRKAVLPYFMSIDSARFRRPVVPSDRLMVHVARQRRRGNVWRFEGRAMVDDHLVAEAIFAAMIMEA